MIRPLSIIALLASASLAHAQSVPEPIARPAALTAAAPPVEDPAPPQKLLSQEIAAAPSATAPAASAITPSATQPTDIIPAASDGTIGPAQIAAVQRANAYFNSVPFLSGRFTQLSPTGNTTEGMVYMLKPGKLRFQYAKPSPLEIVADGTSVVVRDRALNTQDVYPLSQTPLRFLLQPNLDLMRDATVTGVYQEPDFISVSLEDKSAVGGKSRLLIVFSGNPLQLKQWTITDAQGLDTTVTLSDIDTTRKPADKLFEVDYTRDNVDNR